MRREFGGERLGEGAVGITGEIADALVRVQARLRLRNHGGPARRRPLAPNRGTHRHARSPFCIDVTRMRPYDFAATQTIKPDHTGGSGQEETRACGKSLSPKPPSCRTASAASSNMTGLRSVCSAGTA